jgi:putative hydrolase of the HAD superfamily
MASIVAITLDLDDTLWPAGPTLVAAERALGDWMAAHAPRAHVLMTPERRKAIRQAVLADFPHRGHDVSFMRRESLRRALHEAGEPTELAAQAFAVFLEARQQVSLYEDVVPTLEAWSARFPIVALSNGNADIGRIGLGRYFAATIAAHELGFGKPDARIFHEACARVDADPARTLHVGDDLELDVRAARAAGLRAAWVRRPGLKSAAVPDPGVGAFDSLRAVGALLDEA